MKKKKKIYGIEFIRAVFAIGIIIYHFSCHSNSEFLLLFRYANGKWGDLIVTVFFVMSGGILYRNHKVLDSPVEFYKKRFLSLFPLFYLSFLIFFIKNAVTAGKLFYGPAPYTLLLTLIGMDGYTQFAIPNYYILGEWFFGAICLMYLFYPLLLVLIKVRPFLGIYLLTVLYAVTLFVPFGELPPFRNPFSCLFSFYFGMFLFRFPKLLKSRGVLVLCTILVFLLLFVPLPLHASLLSHLSGFSAFIVLFWLGKLAVKNSVIRDLSERIGKLSYPIYLLQHVIIIEVLSRFNPTEPKWYFLLLLGTILLVIMASFLLLKVKELLSMGIDAVRGRNRIGKG